MEFTEVHPHSLRGCCSFSPNGQFVAVCDTFRAVVRDAKNEKISEFTLSSLFSCVIIDGNFAENRKCLGVSAFHLLTISWDGIL